MIHFPTTILDDFFDNPHDIINISKSSKITWKPSENGSWPGVRSQSLVNINKDLFIRRSSEPSLLMGTDKLVHVVASLFSQSTSFKLKRHSDEIKGCAQRWRSFGHRRKNEIVRGTN